MDKKEFNSLIDRISLTGPGGVDKIKKVLKELSDASSSSMGEDEEYTIAQALNDLNDRIEGLQSQIAQRDYIKIDTGMYSPDEIPAHPDVIQKQINDLIQKGTFLYAVFDDGVDFVRILTCVTEEVNGERVATSVSYIYDGEIVVVSFDND